MSVDQSSLCIEHFIIKNKCDFRVGGQTVVSGKIFSLLGRGVLLNQIAQ